MSNEAAIRANFHELEKRAYTRRATKLPGKITFGELSFALDCTIRNISVTGALVSVSNPKDLPKKLFLVEPVNLMAFESNVEWRGANLVGLSFEAIVLLDGELEDRDRILLMHAERARIEWGRKDVAAKLTPDDGAA